MVDRDEYTVVTVDVIGGAFSWASQAEQYQKFGQPGLSYEAHYVSMVTQDEVFPVHDELDDDPTVTKIDCLLHRDEGGLLDGILNHYDGKNPLEQRDAINVWVRPDSQRRGIATDMVREAKRRWPGIEYQKQRYTEVGLHLLDKLFRAGDITP